ncbi:MAG: hypothetical protein Q9201_004042 [Fulgogasparrea decipioides]
MDAILLPSTQTADSSRPSADSKCYTTKEIGGIQLERGAEITNFNKDDMLKLFGDMCYGGKNYPLDKHKDYNDKIKKRKVRLVCEARSALPGGKHVGFDKKLCRDHFDFLEDFCSDYGGELTIDDTLYQIYAFTLPK